MAEQSDLYLLARRDTEHANYDDAVRRLVYAEHTEPCRCVYRQADVPDDTGYGQGWLTVRRCNRHADPSSWRTPNGAPAAVHNG